MRSFTLYDLYHRNARIAGKTDALVWESERMSFADLLNHADALAGGLAGEGIGKGDRLAILAHNDYRFFLLFGAAAALGAVAVPINWRLSDEEIGYILKDSGAKALVVDKRQADRIRQPPFRDVPDLAVFPMTAAGDGSVSIDSLLAAEPRTPVSVEDRDPFCLIYTAAVEGKPRGAVLTHGNMIYGNLQTIATMGLTPKDAYINMLPIFHITGLNLSFSVMHAGGMNVVIEKFDEKRVVEETAKEKISVWGSFPPMLSRLTEAVEAASEPIPSLRHVMGLDGPDPIRAFEKKTGATFWMLYGQTETSGLVTFSPASEKPGSAGKQGLLTQVRVVDESENEVPIGEPGEILVQGPLVFQGFWNRDEDNRRTFRGGWHHTGDLGALDEDGYLWFKGRKPEKELIKPGGENVYPAEVEAVILEHPDVTAVSVIGVPDPRFGEGIKAVCVLKEGAVLPAEDLKEFVASRIARYKKPGYVVFVESLPRKPDGGIDREQVKQTYG